MSGRISIGQFATMLTAAYVASGIFAFPRELVAHAGPEAVYAFLLECLAAFFGLWLWFRVNRIHPDAPLSFAPDLLSVWLAFPALILTLVLHVALAVVVVSDFAFVLHSFFLIETPLIVLQACVVLVAGYVAWFNLPALARTIQFLYILAIIVTVMIGLLLLPHITSVYAVVPTPAISLTPLLYGAYKGSYLFWGYELTVTLYPFLRPQDRAKAEKHAYIAMAITFLFFALGYVLTLGVSGPELLVREIWPGVSTMRLVDIGTFLINKLGLLLVTFWGLFVLTFVMSRLWCLAYDVSPLFRNFSAGWYRGMLLFFGAIVLWGAHSFPTPVQLIAFAQGFLVPTVLIFNFAMPPVFLLAGALQHRRAALRTSP